MQRLTHIAGALLCMLLGYDLFGFGSKLALFGPLGLMFAGAIWLLYAVAFMARPDSWLHRRRKEIALLFGSTTLFVGIAGVLAALIQMGPTTAFRRQHMDRTGQVQAQQADDEIGWSPAGPPDIVGQRLYKIDPSKKHIVMIGDSILYGLNLETAETAPAIMQNKIDNAQVLNLSVSGYSIEQYWLYLKRVLPHTNPKLIVIGLFTGNDFQLTGREYTPWGHSKPVYVVENDQLVKADHSEACIDGLAQSLLFRALWRKQERAVEIIKLFCHPRELKYGELAAAIGKMFEAMETLGKERGVKVVFVLLPTRHELSFYAEDWTRYIGKYAELRRILKAGHHETIDFYEELLKSKADLDEVFQKDNAHYRPLGQQILANVLLKYFGEKGYLN